LTRNASADDIMGGSFAVRQSKTILGAILARTTGVHIILSLLCGEQKDRIRRVKRWDVHLALLATLSASLPAADRFSNSSQ